jgi:hypothetical protein
MATAELWHVIKKEQVPAPQMVRSSEINWPFGGKLISCTFLHTKSGGDS